MTLPIDLVERLQEGRRPFTRGLVSVVGWCFFVVWLPVWLFLPLIPVMYLYERVW
jgi:hypothetical protein